MCPVLQCRALYYSGIGKMELIGKKERTLKGKPFFKTRNHLLKIILCIPFKKFLKWNPAFSDIHRNRIGA